MPNVKPKKINKEHFLKTIEIFCEGKADSFTCAKALGISEPTWHKRANVLLSGEPMPEEWFYKNAEEEQEDTRWKLEVTKGRKYDSRNRRKKAVDKKRARERLERKVERRRQKDRT